MEGSRLFRAPDRGAHGSGPYAVETVALNRSITYRRRPDYWAKDLPVCRGFFNFDRIRFEYFRDTSVAMEAFKAGEIDFREENIAKNWATAYNFPAVQKAWSRGYQIRHQLPTGMQGFVMNTAPAGVRRMRRVRQAVGRLFDFEWTNKNLFYGGYARTLSYFSN